MQMVRASSLFLRFLPLAALGMIFVLAMTPAPAARAYSNGVAASKSNFSFCTGVANCGISSFNYLTQGDLLVAWFACFPWTTTITGVSDASGDLFSPAITMGSSFDTGAPSQNGYIVQTYFVSGLKGTSTGTISITLSTTATYCRGDLEDVNTASVGFAPGFSATFMKNNIPAFTPLTMSTTVGSYLNAPGATATADTFFIWFGWLQIPYGNVGSGGAASFSNPIVPVFKSNPVWDGNPPACGCDPMQYAVGQSFQTGTKTGNIGGATWTGTDDYIGPNNAGMIMLAFTTSGLVSTCSSTNAITSTTGTSGKSGSTFALVSNRTYAWVGYSGDTQITLGPNLNLMVYSVAASGASGGAIKLTMGVYTGSSFPPNVNSPARPFGTTVNTYSLATNGTPQNITMPLSANIPANTWYYLIVGTSHNGVTVYKSTAAGNPISEDTSDAFVSGVPPASLTTFTASVDNLGFWAIITVPCVQTVNVVSVTTVTQVAGTGGVGTEFVVNGGLGNMLLGVIVIIGPAILLAGTTKSLIGGILGAMLGVAVGVFAGILPFYLVVFLSLGVVAMLFFGRHDTGGGL